MLPQDMIQMCSFDASKSTKGASKLRRDLINAEIANLRDLLPLPSSTRQRLSQLQLMALVCVYVRKANYFQQVFRKYDVSDMITANFGFSKAMSIFLMMITQNGKLLYISDNAAEYLGHSMENLLIHGDSIYDIIDKQDHQAVQTELMRSATTTTSSDYDDRLFLCRINVSRNARRQMRFGDQKVVLMQGHFLSFLPLCSRNEPVFLATCTPVAMPETRECVVQGSTNTFTSIHTMDMKFVHLDKNGEFHLGYSKEAIQGTSWYQLIHWDHVQEAQGKHKMITQTDQDRACILLLRLQARPGHWLWLHVVLQVRDAVEGGNSQQHIVCTNQVLSEKEAAVMRSNSWLYHYYSVQSKLQYNMALQKASSATTSAAASSRQQPTYYHTVMAYPAAHHHLPAENALHHQFLHHPQPVLQSPSRPHHYHCLPPPPLNGSQHFHQQQSHQSYAGSAFGPSSSSEATSSYAYHHQAATAGGSTQSPHAETPPTSPAASYTRLTTTTMDATEFVNPTTWQPQRRTTSGDLQYAGQQQPPAAAGRTKDTVRSVHQTGKRQRKAHPPDCEDRHFRQEEEVAAPSPPSAQGDAQTVPDMTGRNSERRRIEYLPPNALQYRPTTSEGASERFRNESTAMEQFVPDVTHQHVRATPEFYARNSGGGFWTSSSDMPGHDVHLAKSLHRSVHHQASVVLTSDGESVVSVLTSSPSPSTTTSVGSPDFAVPHTPETWPSTPPFGVWPRDEAPSSATKRRRPSSASAPVRGDGSTTDLDDDNHQSIVHAAACANDVLCSEWWCICGSDVTCACHRSLQVSHLLKGGYLESLLVSASGGGDKDTGDKQQAE